MSDNKVPDKCLNCEHTIISMENVHQGYLKYQLECVVRCGNDPLNHRVGCCASEVYCDRKEKSNG